MKGGDSGGRCHSRDAERRPAPAMAADASAAQPSALASVWAAVKPFVNGGASGMTAMCFMQPVDVVKTRLQLAAASGATGGTSPFAIVKEIIATRGVGGMWAGLSAGLLRQATYTTGRLGAYRALTDRVAERDQKTGKALPLPLATKAGCGLVAGAFGATVGCPAEVALIRLQAAGGGASLGGVVASAVRNDGILSLWTGVGPTIARAMALNAGSLASYDQVKEIVDAQMGTSGSRTAVVSASLVSGVVGATFSLPFDYVKTQMQASSKFSSSLECARHALKTGGPLQFYSGYPVYVSRIAPTIALTWVILEEFLKLQKKVGL